MQVEVRVDNHRARFIGLTDEQREAIDTELSYAKPGAFFSPHYKPGGEGGWDGRKHFLWRDGISARLFLATHEHLQETCKLWMKVTTNYERVDRTDDATRSDRRYQNECVAKMLGTTLGGVILNATGTGKTYIAGLYCRKVCDQVVFIVDELTLLMQAREEIAQVLGEPVGIIGQGKWEPERVTVATVQTLHSHKKHKHAATNRRYREWAKGLGIVIIDEVHLAMNRRNFAVVKSLRVKVCFGLTATLSMRKKQVRLHAYEICGPVLYDYKLQRGVEEGYLARGLIVMADVWSAGVATGYDYHDTYAELITENQQRNKLITDIVRVAYAAGHWVVLLCQRVPHIKQLSRLLGDVPHQMVYGAVAAETRRQACLDFDAGRLRLIIANTVFKKGVNIRSITFMVECSGGQNQNDAIQRYGRGVRAAPGKVGLVYVDIRDRQTTQGYEAGHDHIFVDAATQRVKAYRQEGIPLLRARRSLGAKKIVNLATKKLKIMVQ